MRPSAGRSWSPPADRSTPTVSSRASVVLRSLTTRAPLSRPRRSSCSRQRRLPASRGRRLTRKSKPAELLKGAHDSVLHGGVVSLFVVPDGGAVVKHEPGDLRGRVLRACQPDGGVSALLQTCLLYTSDAADDLLCVDLGGRRIIKKK